MAFASGGGERVPICWVHHEPATPEAAMAHRPAKAAGSASPNVRAAPSKWSPKNPDPEERGMKEKRRHVELTIDEDGERTRATARPHTADATRISGTGTARRNPADRNVPEIGDELA